MLDPLPVKYNLLYNPRMVTMEELLASQNKKIKPLSRGRQVEGEVITKTDKELILDLGTKSEGVISRREIDPGKWDNLKVGDKLTTFVVMVENESGQTLLSTRQVSAQARGSSSKSRRLPSWSKFISAQNQKSKLTGQVLEVNKGGLIVEVEGSRGFLPNSQVGFELLSRLNQGMSELIGQNIRISVVEIDQANNRLIFSQRGQVSDDILRKLKAFKVNQKEHGKVVAILPFGLVVDIGGLEGLVFISDVSWDKVEDLSTLFKAGQELEVVVLGIDEQLGRLNLSLKQLSEDPFAKLTQKYPADEVIKGEITAITQEGISVKLDGVEGFLASSRVTPDANYEIGKTVTLIVDSVDSKKRRLNLAPLITSTEGLIYK